MNVSIEITLYPFNELYIPPIKSTVEHINTYTGIAVQTFPTATIMTGEYEHVMWVLKETVAWSYKEFGRCVFVTKIIPDVDVLT